MSHTNLGFQDLGQGHNPRSKVCHLKLCIQNNSKTAEVSLIKFHTMVKQNEKMCEAKNLGSHDQGQGHTL